MKQILNVFYLDLNTMCDYGSLCVYHANGFLLVA